MSPTRIDGAHFSPDTRVFIELLHRYGVRYLIVGGEAVIYYGRARLTGDVDFFFAGDAENRRRLFEALAEFWRGDVPGLEGSEDLAPEGRPRVGGQRCAHVLHRTQRAHQEQGARQTAKGPR